MRKLSAILLTFPLVFWPAMSSAEEIVELPPPQIEGKVSVEQALLERRSVREFTKEDLTWEEISQLLWAAQVITEERYGFRTAPSAGALYPLELYVVKREGVYHYLPQGHRLKKTSDGDLRSSLCRAALGQRAIKEAPCDIMITYVYQRTKQKYGQRGIRYVHIEAGHVAQNIHLQAVALGLSSAPIGAFNDSEAKRVLSLPQDNEPICIISVGHPR
jgi:SagB-type dehydrogenase family enzyme